MKNIRKVSGQTDSRVLIFPGRTADIEGKPVFYLFSIRQVAEVLTHVDAQLVPFAPAYVQGIAHWRDRVLPVLSLEQCLGIKQSDNQMPQQTIVVRGVTKDSTDNLHELYAICKVGAGVHHLDFPLECEPVAAADHIPNAFYLHGAYQMQKRLLLVINIEKVLKATIVNEVACTKNQY